MLRSAGSGHRSRDGLSVMTEDGVRLSLQHRPGSDLDVGVVLAHGFTNSMRTGHVRAIAEHLASQVDPGARERELTRV